MLSVKQGGIKYHFFSLRYDLTWDWTPVSWTIDEHNSHLANGPVIGSYYFPWLLFLCSLTIFYLHIQWFFSCKNNVLFYNNFQFSYYLGEKYQSWKLNSFVISPNDHNLLKYHQMTVHYIPYLFAISPNDYVLLRYPLMTVHYIPYSFAISPNDISLYTINLLETFSNYLLAIRRELITNWDIKSRKRKF